MIIRNDWASQIPRDVVDSVYRERNQLVAALSKLFPSHFAFDDTVEPDYRHVICVHLPTGQATWHIHDTEVLSGLFDHLAGQPQPQHWDGHDTAEKYRRLNAIPWGGLGL